MNQEHFHVRQVFYTELQPQLQSAFSDKIEDRDEQNDIQLQRQILWKAVVFSSYHFFWQNTDCNGRIETLSSSVFC